MVKRHVGNLWSPSPKHVHEMPLYIYSEQGRHNKSPGGVSVQLRHQRLQIIGHSLSRVLETRRIGQRAGQGRVSGG